MGEDRRSVWNRFFDDVSRTKGDSEAANSYISVANFRLLRAEVLAMLGDLRGARVLDVGCGTGHFSQPLAAANAVVGVDLSVEMLAFARAKGLAPIRATAEALPFGDKRFDVVLAASVIQLIPDGAAFVREMMRVVRPGGRVIICTINAGNAALGLLRVIERQKYRHFRLYPFREIADLVRAAGGSVRGYRFLYYPFGRTAFVPEGKMPGAIPRIFGTTLVVEAIRPAAPGASEASAGGPR
jgi:ubiquinone/menaquinone biosynthesis C-methylase UbiE